MTPQVTPDTACIAEERVRVSLRTHAHKSDAHHSLPTDCEVNPGADNCIGVYFSRIPVWVFPCLGSLLDSSLRNDQFPPWCRWRPDLTVFIYIHVRLHPLDPTKKMCNVVRSCCVSVTVLTDGSVLRLSRKFHAGEFAIPSYHIINNYSSQLS